MRAVRGVLGPQACAAVTINSGGEPGKGAPARQDLFQQDPFQGDSGAPVGSPGSNGVEQRPPVPPEVSPYALVAQQPASGSQGHAVHSGPQCHVFILVSRNTVSEMRTCEGPLSGMQG